MGEPHHGQHEAEAEQPASEAAMAAKCAHHGDGDQEKDQRSHDRQRSAIAVNSPTPS